MGFGGRLADQPSDFERRFVPVVTVRDQEGGRPGDLTEPLAGVRISDPPRRMRNAIRVAERSAEFLAAGLAACINLFAAERVVLGGGVM
ncbi:MAG: hypothetical protein P8049_00830, partial [Gemmatimonadota bacterium]